MFLAAATAGPAGAMVANLTPAALHGTAFAILTLANNAFGLAPGPIVTGWLADRIGLLGRLAVAADGECRGGACIHGCHEPIRKPSPYPQPPHDASHR